MNSRISCLWFGLLLGSLMTLPAFAHRDHGEQFRYRIEAGPMIGWPLVGDVIDDGIAYGFQIDYHWSPSFSIEGSYTAFDDRLDNSLIGRQGLPTSAVTDLRTRDLSLSGKLNFFGGQQWNIYAGGGVSYVDWNTDNRRVDDRIDQQGGVVIDLDVDVETAYGAHALIGIDLGLTDHWELFGEYRHTFMSSEVNLNIVTERTENQPIENMVEEDFDYDYGMIRVGLNYRW